MVDAPPVPRLAMWGRRMRITRPISYVARGSAAFLIVLAVHFHCSGTPTLRARGGTPPAGVSWLLRTVHVGSNPVAVVIAGRSGHIFVVNRGPVGRDYQLHGRGSVSVLDATTEHLLHTVAVDWDPVAAVSDARTGRVFVLKSGHAHHRTSARKCERARRDHGPCRTHGRSRGRRGSACRGAGGRGANGECVCAQLVRRR